MPNEPAGNASSKAIQLAEFLEDPESYALLEQVFNGPNREGALPRSFLNPGARRARAPLQFQQWSTPQRILDSANVPGIQPVQSGAIQFLGGSPTPIDGPMRTAALMSLGTNLLEAARAVQRRQADRPKRRSTEWNVDRGGSSGSTRAPATGWRIDRGNLPSGGNPEFTAPELDPRFIA